MGQNRILIVDDEPAFARALARLLDRMGDSVTAFDYDSAARLLRNEEFEVAFFDVVLGGTRSGLDLAKEALSIHPNLPIVILTGHVDHDLQLANQSIDLGCYACNKPLSPGRLSRLVAMIRTASNDLAVALPTGLRRWSTAYNLTGSETAILAQSRALVLHGERNVIQRLAEKRRVSVSTIKTHVKNLLAKTGDRNLLVALLRLTEEVRQNTVRRAAERSIPTVTFASLIDLAGPAGALLVQPELPKAVSISMETSRGAFR